MWASGGSSTGFTCRSSFVGLAPMYSSPLQFVNFCPDLLIPTGPPLVFLFITPANQDYPFLICCTCHPLLANVPLTNRALSCLSIILPNLHASFLLVPLPSGSHAPLAVLHLACYLPFRPAYHLFPFRFLLLHAVFLLLRLSHFFVSAPAPFSSRDRCLFPQLKFP